jgi:restriction system protein
MLLAATTFLITGLATSFFLYRHRLPLERRAAGRNLLSAMDQGDFLQLVLAVLNARGYERGFGGGGTEGEYLLQRRGQDWLLSSRHSRAYLPGSTAIAEFANHLRQRGIQGGILAIPGRFPRPAFALGRAHRVELLDGASMWDELQPLLNDEQHAAIDHPARARLKWQFAIAWLVAFALAAAVYLALPQEIPATSLPHAGAASAAIEVPGANESRLVPLPQRQSPPTQPSTAPIQARRVALAEAIAKLPHVSSASWPTESTLLVAVDSEHFDPRAGICPLLEQDDDLRASRLQLQLPAGSERPVRFLQCRAY